MNIISHRGCWSRPEEKNSFVAFERSFTQGFGTETDFRDYGGQLVISHDTANAAAISAVEVLTLLTNTNSALPIAINIKADGLQRLIRGALEYARVDNYFLFDMSVPDAIQSIKAGLRIYTRHSDVETVPVLYSESAGVWMDAFYDYAWLTPAKVLEHLERGKEVCLVSPELHGRPHVEFWDELASSPVSCHDRLTLCTDLPEDAQAFFSYD